MPPRLRNRAAPKKGKKTASKPQKAKHTYKRRGKDVYDEEDEFVRSDALSESSASISSESEYEEGSAKVKNESLLSAQLLKFSDDLIDSKDDIISLQKRLIDAQSNIITLKDETIRTKGVEVARLLRKTRCSSP